ncbi:MAG: hypothetical protein ACM3Z4_14560 [Hyphomicrobiales bacterium]|jgi:hypothetical protein
MSGLRLVRDLWADAFEHLGLPRPVEVAPADVLERRRDDLGHSTVAPNLMGQWPTPVSG